MRRSTAILLAGLMLLAACGRSPRQAAISSPTPEPSLDATAEASPVSSAEASPAGSPAAGTPGRTATARPSAAPPAPPPPGVAAGPRLKDIRIKLVKIAELGGGPLAMDLHGGDIYIVEKAGRIRAIRGGQLDSTTVLDITSEVSTGSEQGLLGLAFSPDGRYLYVHFTNKSGDTRVREYAAPAQRVDTSTAREVLAVDQPFSNHNGGHLVFGLDGKLYIGLGDGGSANDPLGNGQSLATLLGKMLRIDPRPSGSNAYGIPADNPFVGTAGARGEIWAYGLRNPWRYSFDRATNDLWISDVGQNQWEEVDFQPASSRGGENFGWDRMEGTHSFEGSPPANHTPPVYEYSHDEGCSITGGYVYRGAKITAMQGAYIFVDYCAGRLRAVAPGGAKVSDHHFLGPQLPNASSFGEDDAGELYMMSLDGGVYRIDPA